MIYLDNNATTPCDPRVVETMLPFFYDQPGNASSRNHAWGWMAEDAVKKARRQVANLIGADPKEIIFTSGATEADNLAILGVLEQYRRKGAHLITLATEHKAVLDACARAEQLGATVTRLLPRPDGQVDLEALEAAIRPDTILVAIMWANNETGVLQPMQAIGNICERHGLILMSDGTQMAGKLPCSPREAGVHLMAFTAHKMYGPKGIGALYVSRRQPKVGLVAQQYGGGHEQGLRSGTLNVPGIVGFGQAAAIALEEMAATAERLNGLRSSLEAELLKVPLARLNGHSAHRLPHTTNICFPYAESEAVMMRFGQQLALSSGSACTSASVEPSHVLTAMGLSADEAHSSLRFSLGRFTQTEEVARAVALVREAVAKVRQASPAWEMYQEK
ncbi:cysteine desulfurase family protein [Phaeodactylibacter luteus]|uniref:cysteine desulfurase n=1 Tax=Phaeodactylibacter luteus TaxID=1564516 RepID=A0A5C6S6P7_9BACT|nr:aminotransferase class V-fold PLP-dependent enzyme [Phaeodactylibacter luteus]TXB70170.1 aminotransferase class V-fold PLP-dependent enzyme [Phaeodactylibacter luteus]